MMNNKNPRLQLSDPRQHGRILAALNTAPEVPAISEPTPEPAAEPPAPEPTPEPAAEPAAEPPAAEPTSEPTAEPPAAEPAAHASETTAPQKKRLKKTSAVV